MDQSHNHIKRFEGLVLPDGLENLFLVRKSHGVAIKLSDCRIATLH
jgi:hypothetical protein